MVVISLLVCLGFGNIGAKLEASPGHLTCPLGQFELERIADVPVALSGSVGVVLLSLYRLGLSCLGSRLALWQQQQLSQPF